MKYFCYKVNKINLKNKIIMRNWVVKFIYFWVVWVRRFVIWGKEGGEGIVEIVVEFYIVC